MALKIIEGFDHLSGATQMAAKGWTLGTVSLAGPGGTNSVSAQTGRVAGKCCRLSILGNSNVGTEDLSFFHKSLPASLATVICGFAVKFPSVPALTVQNPEMFAFAAGTTRTLRIQLNQSSMKLEVRNSSNTLIATGTTVLSTGSWYYIEVKLFVNGASGTCEVHLNGATEIASTVGNFGSTSIDAVQCEWVTLRNVTSTCDFDDLYVVDTSGSVNNTFLGDVRVATSFPSGAGASAAWTPLSGANYTNVDENPPTDDTDYIASSNVGDIDTYAFDDIPAGSVVAGIQTCLYARKDDAAVRQIAPVVRQSGSNDVGTTHTLGTSYAFFTQIRETDPAAAAWTVSNVNGDEYGVKEIA